MFTRVLFQETELTANTGLLTEHNFQGFGRSHDRRVITWSIFKFGLSQRPQPSGFVLKKAMGGEQLEAHKYLETLHILGHETDVTSRGIST